MATEIMKVFSSHEEIYPGLLELVSYCEMNLVADPNRNQRDLLEEGEDDTGFFHDNEHQYRMTLDTKCPWVGVRPKAPPKYPWRGEWNDPSLQTEFSDGEEFHEFNLLGHPSPPKLPVQEGGECSAQDTNSSDHDTEVDMDTDSSVDAERAVEIGSPDETVEVDNEYIRDPAAEEKDASVLSDLTELSSETGGEETELPNDDGTEV